ncbi:cytochrome protein [Melanomma pulvis-pyrius CBS 109.77]|uniref:Cytochrome protein n=1 Tax=Melanomma pulvis-pyrius CBS 109.77 TaxID=1314802 RepID=A0A6A6XS64_9PLEO|nr:cytochrome protein [Melanomma pulvis-pyrius CBS 109.77]
MGTKTWVLLNSSRVVNEIIAKRATKTHERPYFLIAGELVSQNKRLFLHRTSAWREGRRLLHQLLLGAASKNHGQLVEQASLELLRAYLDEPKSWYAHNYRFAVTVINRIITNAPLQKSSMELEDLQRVTSTFLVAINSSPVEFFPCAEASFVRETILQDYSGTEEQKMYLTMLAISAGADNPRMTMNAWIMACLAHPDKMELARREIDSVCGDACRLPKLDDLQQLPYMCAVVKERVLVESLEFEGYQFPAGTEFLINSVAVCSNLYEKPEEFRPERWLKSRNDGGGITHDLWQFAFSGGMRSCVGYRLAQKELFISFTRLLYCFEFLPAGVFNETELNPFDLGEPFPVNVLVRGKKYENIIRGITNHS